MDLLRKDAWTTIVTGDDAEKKRRKWRQDNEKERKGSKER